MENFKIFQINAINYIQNNDLDDLDENLGHILFPFIELLGYDVVDPYQVTSKPVYIQDNEDDDFFNYGLIENYENEEYKVIIKAFPFGAELNNYERLVKKAFELNKSVKYAVLTDCVSFKVYENINPSVNDYEMLAEIDIIQLYNDNETTEAVINDFIILKNISKDNSFNVLSYLDSDYIDDDLLEEVEEPKPEPKKNQKKIKAKKEKKITAKGVILISLALLTIFMAIAGMVLKNKEETVEEPKIKEEKEDKLEEDLNGIFNGLKTGMGANAAYIELTSTLELNLDNQTEELHLNLISDIKKDAVIRFEIINDNNHAIVYAQTDKDGNAKTTFNIPTEWNRPVIQVAAYLRFDEEDNKQPDHIKKAYGNNGENIVWKKDSPEFGLTFQEINFNNERVQEYLKSNNDQSVSSSNKDKNKIIYTSDADGNFRIKPKGFDMDKVNLRENRSVYPEILYNAKEDRAYLQVVFGIMTTEFKHFDKVGFIVDGNTWAYDVNSNIKKTKVAGINLAEWAYFNNYDNPRLYDHMRLLANSQEAKIIFTGAGRKEHLVTLEEKENIRFFLYLYEKYYTNNITHPDLI